MPSGIAQRAREVVKEPLPDLARGPRTTGSSALKDIKYVGILEHWSSFGAEVLATYQDTPWQTLNATIKYRSRNPDNPAAIDSEHFLCGGEPGVQARMQSNLAQVMSAVCAASGVDLTFGDYYSTTDRATGASTPDMAIMTSAGEIRALGELKVPWVPDHQLLAAIERPDSSQSLRHILGQVAQYMKQGELKYGFVTTYDETVFLKQECRNGIWVLRYSSPIRSGAKFDDRTPGGRAPVITLRQAFWHLLACINEDHKAANPILPTAWTVRRR